METKLREIFIVSKKVLLRKYTTFSYQRTSYLMIGRGKGVGKFFFESCTLSRMVRYPRGKKSWDGSRTWSGEDYTSLKVK